MKLYVAGPMTGLPDCNVPAFRAATAALRNRRHVVLCPSEAFGGVQTLETKAYARHDLMFLLQVDGVVLLDGWERSVGACTEVAAAHWLGLTFWTADETGWLTEIWPESPVHAFRDAARRAVSERTG